MIETDCRAKATAATRGSGCNLGKVERVFRIEQLPSVAIKSPSNRASPLAAARAYAFKNENSLARCGLGAFNVFGLRH